MRTSFIPWADAAFDQLQAYQRAAFFVLGCIEREQAANLKAVGAYWPWAPGDWLNAMERFGIAGSRTLHAGPAPAESPIDVAAGSAACVAADARHGVDGVGSAWFAERAPSPQFTLHNIHCRKYQKDA